MDLEEIYNTIQKYSPNNKKITNMTYSRKILVLMRNTDIENIKDTLVYINKKYSQKTFKSFLTSLVVFNKANGNTELAEKYGSELKKVNDIIQEKEKTNIPTKKEKQNMISRLEINKLIKETKNILDNLVLAPNYYNYFDIYKKYLVLNLYYLIPPIRNDYVGCEVHELPVENSNIEKNYIYLSTKKLVLNRYKTSKAYGQGNEIQLPDPLVEIIRTWIKVRNIVYPNLIGNNELLLTKNLSPMSQVNLTQFLNRTFGKNVSSTILRKSYLSEKYPVTHSISEMEKDARAMQHSVFTQQQTYRKKTT